MSNWNSRRTVRLDVTLPDVIADQAEEVARTDPDFISRVVLYGLTRRSIYRFLRNPSETEERERKILAEATEHERRILEENDG